MQAKFEFQLDLKKSSPIQKQSKTVIIRMISCIVPLLIQVQTAAIESNPVHLLNSCAHSSPIIEEALHHFIQETITRNRFSTTKCHPFPFQSHFHPARNQHHHHSRNSSPLFSITPYRISTNIYRIISVRTRQFLVKFPPGGSYSVLVVVLGWLDCAGCTTSKSEFHRISYNFTIHLCNF